MVIIQYIFVYLCFDMSLLFNVHFFFIKLSFLFLFFIFATGFYIPVNKNYKKLWHRFLTFPATKPTVSKH